MNQRGEKGKNVLSWNNTKNTKFYVLSWTKKGIFPLSGNLLWTVEVGVCLDSDICEERLLELKRPLTKLPRWRAGMHTGGNITQINILYVFQWTQGKQGPTNQKKYLKWRGGTQCMSGRRRLQQVSPTSSSEPPAATTTFQVTHQCLWQFVFTLNLYIRCIL